MSTDTKALAQRIATVLKEDNVALLEKVVEVAGPDKAAQMLKKAAELYKAGLMTFDKSRARTLGGCYFYVARQRLNRAQRIQAGLFSQQESQALNNLKQQGHSPEQAADYLAEKNNTLAPKEFKELVGQLAKGPLTRKELKELIG